MTTMHVVANNISLLLLLGVFLLVGVGFLTSSLGNVMDEGMLIHSDFDRKKAFL
jgi:hypothetical protein